MSGFVHEHQETLIDGDLPYASHVNGLAVCQPFLVHVDGDDMEPSFRVDNKNFRADYFERPEVESVAHFREVHGEIRLTHEVFRNLPWTLAMFARSPHPGQSPFDVSMSRQWECHSVVVVVMRENQSNMFFTFT